jgi:hypothetical protein
VELANNWYYRLILQDLSNLDEVASKVLPANRQVVNRFISSWMLDGVDDIMCGVQDTDAYDGLDWDHHFLFGQFKEYIFEKERRMAKVLDKLKYSIDQENTLALVTGGGRPETVSVGEDCGIVSRTYILSVYSTVASSLSTSCRSCCSPCQYCRLA